MSYMSLSKREEAIAKLIVDAAFAIYKGLAHGLLEIEISKASRYSDYI